ncbi:MAG: hypothetical protein ACTMKZ_09430 [Brevibacterium aurantiacum]|uniref:Uncharacterized protein n=1 Tax=Brevibacterium aurantiacum TaxID=273384 RepID=A0A2H1KVC5_BREAU|nr:hypothetical protein [Brevibacterium aurantiacum]AZL10958.1 hypothetical protein CXR26_18335 [Brevibacterium aurantiacum]PCC56068.1 hypothetical protein CIK58_15765 [Brevibacterium aurantiacum]RCS93948.1 hypothetical protein CIK61_13810 [Brevibacterium aurantiacum]RCS99760.1 hypothetical protein CIK60_03425 [Brevibacterium aurantiacum]SMY03743.1 hypothetical protein BAURA86_03447 [Brevibacterium aurantiacum]
MTTYVLKEETALSVRGGPVTIHFDPAPQGAKIVASTSAGESTQLVKRLGTGVAILPTVDQTLTVGIESGVTSFERGTSVSVRLQIDSGLGRETDEIHVHAPLDISGAFQHPIFSISPDAEMLHVALIQDARRPSTVMSDLAEAARVSAVRQRGDSSGASAVKNFHIVLDGSASFKSAADAGLREVLEILTGIAGTFVDPESLSISIADRELSPIRKTGGDTAVDDAMSAFATHPLRSSFLPDVALRRQTESTLTVVVSDVYDHRISGPSAGVTDFAPVHQVILAPAQARTQTFDDSTMIINASLAETAGLDDQSRSAELDSIVRSLLATVARPPASEERPRS